MDGHEPKRVTILVLFYSFTGATSELAKVVAEGANSVAGADVTIKQMPETLPESFFDDKPKLKAARAALNKEFPAATLDDLTSADGIALGSPTHFGSFASQWKAFFDQLSPVWLEGKLVNKPVALFCTAGSMHGGEEATLLAMMTPLLNLGMVPVGIPYPIQGESPDFDAGSPYGAIFVTGHKGEKKMTEADKKVARILGIRLATMTRLLNCGCEACGLCQTMSGKLS